MMSTSDSAILAGASVFTENVLPSLGKKVDDVQKLWWTRMMVVVIGMLCIVIALVIGETYRLALMAWSVLLVGMFVPFAFGMYWQSANRSGALSAIVGGILTWIGAVCYYFPHTRAKHMTPEGVYEFADAAWDAVYIGSPPALVVSLVLMVVVSLATKKFDPPLPLTDADGNPLPLRKRLGFLPFSDVFRDVPEANAPAATEVAAVDGGKSS